MDAARGSSIGFDAGAGGASSGLDAGSRASLDRAWDGSGAALASGKDASLDPMRKPRLLLPLVLGAALCTGGRVDAATSVERASAVARPAPAPVVEFVLPAAPIVPGASDSSGPTTFALGVWTLVGLGVLRWRRKRFIAETAAL